MLNAHSYIFSYAYSIFLHIVLMLYVYFLIICSRACLNYKINLCLVVKFFIFYMLFAFLCNFYMLLENYLNFFLLSVKNLCFFSLTRMFFASGCAPAYKYRSDKFLKSSTTEVRLFSLQDGFAEQLCSPGKRLGPPGPLKR